MKKFCSFSKLIIFVSVILALDTCQKDEPADQPDNSALLGDWINNVDASPHGLYIYELIFKIDGTFTEKSSAFGIYEEQDENELSGWFIRTGNFETHKNKLYCTFKKVVSWDGFYGGEPETSDVTGIIFENCSYSIQNNILELNYITYPADAPVVTVRQYHRPENL